MEELSMLVQAAQAGDEQAYDTLIGRFQRIAYAIAYEHLKDYHLAQDAVQDALLEAYVHLDTLKEPAAFPGWFRQIVFYRCMRILRRPVVDSMPLDRAAEVLAPDLERIAEQYEMQAHVRKALRELPPHERTVAALYYFAEYSQKEIGVLLGLPVTTVKKRLYAARQRLREYLRDVAADREAIARYLRSVQQTDKSGVATNEGQLRRTIISSSSRRATWPRGSATLSSEELLVQVHFDRILGALHRAA